VVPAGGGAARTLAAQFVHHPVVGHLALRQSMPPRFLPDAVQDDAAQFFQPGALTQWGEQVDLFFAQQAQAQFAAGGQAGAAACRAKRLAER